MKHVLLLLTITSLLALGCRRERPNKPRDRDIQGLPPATQTGANTLGFLLNGKPWTPQGNNGTANLSIDFDPGIKNGYVSIAARQFLPSNIAQLIIGIRDSVNFSTPPQQYKIGRQHLGATLFTDTNHCRRMSDDVSTYSEGYIKITILDHDRGIVAGTFEFKLFTPECGDTIRITEGRFDMRF